MKILFEVYKIDPMVVFVPSHDYYTSSDKEDEYINNLKFIEEFDTEEEAIEFVTNIDTKNCTYTILKTYNT